MVWLFHSPVTVWEEGDLYLAQDGYYLSSRRLEEGQGGRQHPPVVFFLAPVLVPDVEGDNEDNDDDGGEEHHPHDEEGGAGHSGAVGQGRRCTLHPEPQGQGSDMERLTGGYIVDGGLKSVLRIHDI
jgi:hypothetical protein